MNPILLIGASSALAQSTAELLISKGFHVIGISTKERIGSFSDWHQIKDYRETSLPRFDFAIGGMVYFPGSISLKPFHRFTEEDIQQVFDIHVYGAMSCAKTYWPNLKQNPGSSVVFISSVAATTGMPFHGLIGPAKSAIEGLTKALAAEWAPNIRVNAVAPSLVDTPMSSKFLDTPVKEESMKKRNPLQRIGQPIEIAQSIEFLINNQSSWITGQILAVDGGMGQLKI